MASNRHLIHSLDKMMSNDQSEKQSVFNNQTGQKSPYLAGELFWLISACMVFFLNSFLLGVEEPTFADAQIYAWLITGFIFFAYLLQMITGRFIFYSARNVVLIGVVYWILSDVLQTLPQLYKVRPEILLRGLSYVFLFVICVQGGYLFRPSGWLKMKIMDLKDPKYANLSFFTILATFFIGIFPYFHFSDWSIAKVWYGILSSRNTGVEVGWRRDIFGDERAIVLALEFFLTAFPSLVAFYFISFKKNYFKKMVLFCFTLIVWVSKFYIGTRQALGFVVLAPLLIFYLALSEKKKKSFLFIAGIVVILLFYMMEIQVSRRSYGFVDRRSSIITTTSQDTDAYVTIDDNFFQFSELIDVVPSKFGYSGFHELWFLMTMPVPRFLWEEKPVGFGTFFARQFKGAVFTTYSYSVLGDFYVCFGVWGILIGGILFGILARNLDALIVVFRINKTSICIFTLCLVTLAMAVRSLQIFVVFGYYLLAFLLVRKLLTVSLRS